MDLPEQELASSSGMPETMKAEKWQNYTPEVKQSCDKAVRALKRGNRSKAEKIMKQTLTRFPNVSLCLRVNAHIHSKLSSIIDEPVAKQRHLKQALEAAQKAAELSPNSVEFCFFYAQLLLETSDGNVDEVIKECQRGLSITNPVDPAQENLQEHPASELTSAQDRINQIQQDIRALQQRACLISISSIWRTIDSPGHKDIQQPPVRRVPEGAQERGSPLAQVHQQRQVPESLEERRREIADRVAAARLLQQQQRQMDSAG